MSQPLTPDRFASLVEEFSRWFAALPEPPAEPAPAAPRIDLSTALGQFVALRQEVNLQTRAGRAAVEQGQRQFDELLERLPVADEEPEEDEGVPEKVLKGLIDLWDALAAARKPLDRARQSLADLLDQEIPEPPLRTVRFSKPRPWWKLWGGVDSETDSVPNSELQDWLAARRSEMGELRLKALGALDGVIAGYRMSQDRATRLLELAGYEALEPEGERFDPEWMEAAELVAADGRESGEVATVVRRGYRRDGVVVRTPQVTVTR